MKALVLVGLIAIAVACGDSSGPGKQAASVTGIAGDSQLAPTGAQLAFPLSLVALGSDGQPVQALNVTWSASPTGRVTFNPQSTPTNASGVASTTVTAGGTPGEVVILASVPGVQPVVFHALVLDPCSFAVAHTLGTSVNAALTTTDCKLGSQFQYYYDFYGLSLASQTGITINMTANFDTWIDFYRDTGAQLEYLGYHDDISVADSNLNSSFQAILPAGDYIIGANTADTLVTGSYTFASAVRAQTITNCQELWVTRGVVINDNIASTDCTDTTGVGSYGDSVKIIVTPLSVLKIAARSSAVNPRLALFQVIFRNGPDSLALLASNDDSAAATQNAYIAYSAPAGNQLLQLVLFAGTTGTGQTGAYTLDISSATTLSAMASRPAWRGRALPTDPFQLLKRSRR